MKKVYVVARAGDQDPLLKALHRLGVMHLIPVDPTVAAPDEKTLAQIEKLQRAAQSLAPYAPAGPQPKISPAQAAEETLHIHQESADLTNRLALLHRQIEQLHMWGEVRLKTLQQLRDAGISAEFFSIPVLDVDQIQAQCVEVLSELPKQRRLVAVVGRDQPTTLPKDARFIPLPPQDRPAIRAEAQQIDGALTQQRKRLSELAHLIDAMHQQIAELQTIADLSLAARSAVADESLLALQGWVPASSAENLALRLSESGIEAAVQVMSPSTDEEPPTLIDYPAWVKPIKGLFDILGTTPGYREFDVGMPFLIALPIFAAILIGDGGYGALLCLGLWFTRAKASTLLGKDFTALLIIVGAVALGWGFLCGSFFGVVLYNPPIPVDMSEHSRSLVMKISFIMGAIHLITAQLWQACRWFPDLRFLNKIGWALFIGGMFGVVQMFVLSATLDWHTPWPYLLCIGGAMTILFKHPDRNILKMIGWGLADFPLSMLSAFSDVISYVRLMAVGLASSVLASSFNELALDTGSWIMAIPIMLMGHALNFGLAMIALFAHGVRLNMLEFSSNLGMQWTGYAYKPFMRSTSLEN